MNLFAKAGLNSIPEGRALLYIILACWIPIILVLMLLYSQFSEVEETEEELEYFKERVATQQRKQANNRLLLAHFKEADHFYIDKNLETLTLLEPEIESLQKIVKQKNFPDDESIKKRLEFLTGQANALSFSEGMVQRFGPVQETVETLNHPVEVNLQDLHKILARVEGVKVAGELPPPGRPQLLILELKLDKQKHGDKNEVYLLNMKLLKREFS